MKKWWKKQNKGLLLFLFSFIYLFFLGLLLSYHYDISSNYNLLFDSDTGRVILDATEVVAEHYRANVHPLFILWIQPLVFLLTGIVQNKLLAILLLSTITSSLSVFFIYKILEEIKQDEKINLLISLIYLFSFSNLIFTTSIETYNFASLFLIMMWYYFIRKEKEKYNIYSYGILILFAIFTFSFTITNICIYLIMIFLLWISKKLKIKNIFIIGIISLSLVVILNIGQKLVWHEAPLFWKINTEDELNFVKESTLQNKLKTVITNDYYDSILSSNIEMKIRYGNLYNGQNYMISFKPINLLNFLLLTSFYILLIFLVVRNFKKKKLWNSALTLSLLFNTILHLIYGTDSAYLYSLHFLYLIILLIGTNLHLEENKRFKKYTILFLMIFLLFQVIMNNQIFYQVLQYVKGVLNLNYLLANTNLFVMILVDIGIILILLGSIYLLYILLKLFLKDKKIERKIILSSFMLLILIVLSSFFIELNSIEKSNRFLWINLKGVSNKIEAKEKIDYLEKDFKTTFQKQLQKLDAYQEEIKELKEEYSTITTTNLNWTDYYYFGMGNRRKIIYRPNSLIDIETKEVIEQFNEKEHYLIPNEYTVLIKTTSNDYIEIVEKEDGVHFIKNNKDKIIEGTNNKINFYSFEGQKYQNIKKELYGEILFNIKDSVIYPNIIVYDKPWYRDAAITCMVLKETNNTDLIKKWVEEINELYDKQNKGIEEVDNLGELLYILSTQKELRIDLIDKIEEEAERIATNNPNGYYLYGKTDYGNQFLYQNLWYQLGIESVGRSYHFDLSSIKEDEYSKMAWWSDYETAKEEKEADEFYPYLSYARRHKLKIGTIPINDNLYPLSWETLATEAHYENYSGIDDEMTLHSSSPLHTWSASEFLLLLLDETGDYQTK